MQLKSRARKSPCLQTRTAPCSKVPRLTAWELMQSGHRRQGHLATTRPAAVLRSEEIDCCIVGADRIAKNGDVANKIGTYGLAILAREHGVPFYVAAPVSTLDMALASGAENPH